MRIILIIVFLLLLACSSVGVGRHPSSASSDQRRIPTVSYCALLEDQKLHTGMLVRIKASWQFGFETSYLYDPSCSEQPKAWLEFADEKELCPETKTNRSVPGQSDKGAAVTLRGRLYGPGRYGHLGDYQFKFVVFCLEEIKVTSSDLK